jgi:uncharacterized membrane protein YfcA
MESIYAVGASLGAIVGLILALTGAGGAILAVPLLVFGLHLRMAEAGPIALLAVGVSAAVGALIGSARYRALSGSRHDGGKRRAGLARRAMARAPGAERPADRVVRDRAGLGGRAHVQAEPRAAISGLSGLNRHAAAGPLPPCQLDDATGRFVWTASCTRALAASGIGAGFLSGLLGVGGGFVIVPALRRATNAPVKTIVATSLAVITLVSASGVVSTALAGNMNWHVAAPFAAGAMLGMLVGRLFASRLSGQRLQQGFAVVAGLIAIGMVVKVVLAV